MYSTATASRVLCASGKLSRHRLPQPARIASLPTQTQTQTQTRLFTITCRAAYAAVPLPPARSGSGTDFDALVVGAGAGGVTAAALLSKRGYRTLLVEAKERIGGRASTRPIDGFLVNTGALVIELDGAVAKTYEEVGLPLSLHEPRRAATVLRVGRRDFNVVENLAGVARNILPSVFASASRMLPYFRPEKGESTRSWLNKFTRSRAIHHLIDNVLGAMFAARSDEIPAEAFLHYFVKDTSYKRIGLPPGGTIEVWKPLANYVETTGGQVWLNSTVSKLTFGPDGLVTGAIVRKSEGSEVQVTSKVTVSNIGPLGTVRLAGADNLPGGYAEEIKRWSDPAAIITVHFASQQPLATFPCLAIFSKSRRMVYAGNFSAPELHRAPKGWYLYCGASVPVPARGQFDVEEEKALLLQDLRDHFPGFEKAKILAIDVTAHDWPAQRAVTCSDQPQTTAVANLFNVGDGAKPWASGGTAACAWTGQIVAEMVTKQFPLTTKD
ncbi:hypothetical protein A1O3_00793 [Capronia epimyces CBS 606.96]|uniref:Amine oxidase domain-containing protein n=1 Tax=Capronia epimyces CBS 606.96 TaxID=1182542 RepID=W9YI63_9EURO|nr:uncharacterized protein A1O3_00793 [Capronia epimyces CBS 606.96]EXJ92243.1 hypothetical protein A1O3_00793 [Capronia epimyces CBS 606.96]